MTVETFRDSVVWVFTKFDSQSAFSQLVAASERDSLVLCPRDSGTLRGDALKLVKKNCIFKGPFHRITTKQDFCIT